MSLLFKGVVLEDGSIKWSETHQVVESDRGYSKIELSMPKTYKGIDISKFLFTLETSSHQLLMEKKVSSESIKVSIPIDSWLTEQGSLVKFSLSMIKDEVKLSTLPTYIRVKHRVTQKGSVTQDVLELYLDEIKDLVEGVTGEEGLQGERGLSAYEVAVEDGFKGSVEEWLESLVGRSGDSGTDGKDGKSAYEVWLESGNEGTEQEFLNSLVGAKGQPGQNGEDGLDGKDGESAYQAWLSNGNDGTEEDFLNSLKGVEGFPGERGHPGRDGADGKDGKSAYEVWIAQGESGTEEDFLNSLKGEPGLNGQPGKDGLDGKDGQPGRDGLDGKSAYQIWLEKGNKGAEEDFINSLKGERGPQGIQGPPGEVVGSETVIDKIQVNEKPLDVVDKTVNIEIPSKISELENDEHFITKKEVPTIEGPKGERGDPGKDGLSLDFKWEGTKLGVKKETEEDYSYQNLKGEPGTTEYDKLVGKPTALSSFDNDSGYTTEEELEKALGEIRSTILSLPLKLSNSTSIIEGFVEYIKESAAAKGLQELEVKGLLSLPFLSVSQSSEFSGPVEFTNKHPVTNSIIVRHKNFTVFDKNVYEELDKVNYIRNINGGDQLSLWVGTQVEYDKLVQKSPTTIYKIVEE